MRSPSLVALWLLAQACSASPTPSDGGLFGPLLERVQTTRGVTSCEVAGVALSADVVRPTAATHLRRAALLVHGGGWSTGSRADYDFLAQSLASLGLTSVSVDYRLSPAARHPQHVEDVKCSLRWLRTHAAALDVDPARIVVIGASAGAHLAAFLAYTPDEPRLEGSGAPSTGGTRVAAAVLHGGPHELTRLDELNAEQRGTVFALLGTDTPTVEQLRDASPVTWVQPGAVPTLILHGSADQVVPAGQAELLAARLSSVDAGWRLVVIPDAGHSDFGANPDAVNAELTRFLQATLF